MSGSGGSTGFWQSARTLPARTPLRVKLITAVLTLVAIALVVISFSGLGFLRSYLLDQADASVAGLSQQQAGITDAVQHYLFRGQPVPATAAIVWLPNGGKPHAVALEVNHSQLGSPSSGQGMKPGPAVEPGASWLKGNELVTIGATSGITRYRAEAFPGQTVAGPDGPVNGTVVIAWDATSAYRTLGKLTGIDIIVSGILLLGLAVIGAAMIRSSLRPLTDIEKTAQAIAAGDLSRRVPDRDPRTEVGRLGRSLNAMLAQIESAFNAQARSEAAARRSEDRMRQFVADASHELRTPLTAIRGFAEYYRQRGGVAVTGTGEGPGSPGPAAIDPPAAAPPEPAGGMNGNGTGQLAPADLDRIMRRLEQESSRMGILVEDMLLLARLDQQRPLEHRTVDLLTLAADAVHDARVVAPGRSINLTVGSGAALLVQGDEVRLRQVIGNLMSNALSHTPEGTPIDVRIRSGSLAEAQWPTAHPAPPPPPPPGQDDSAGPRSAAVLEVADHGPGMTREQAEHAFERFYRGDQARTSGGSGLGLAIVAALVAAHGGAVWVESAPGAGATFRIALPLTPEARHEAEDELDEQAEQAERAEPAGQGEPGPTA
jgi:two-component system OmpR family sensor kinase